MAPVIVSRSAVSAGPGDRAPIITLAGGGRVGGGGAEALSGGPAPQGNGGGPGVGAADVLQGAGVDAGGEDAVAGDAQLLLEDGDAALDLHLRPVEHSGGGHRGRRGAAEGAAALDVENALGHQGAVGERDG